MLTPSVATVTMPIVDAESEFRRANELFVDEDYESALDEFGDESFEVSIGAEAIKKILVDMDLDEEVVKIREELTKTGSEIKRNRFQD